jgi:hypothetical protein
MTFPIAKSTGHSCDPHFLFAASRRKQPDTIREAGSGQTVSFTGITPAEETSEIARVGMKHRHGITP